VELAVWTKNAVGDVLAVAMSEYSVCKRADGWEQTIAI
jgi:hypothetical protein